MSGGDWHAMEAAAVLKHFNSDQAGLSSAQARERLQQSGANALVSEEGVNPWLLLIRQLRNPLIYLLLAAAGLSLLTGHTIDALVILGVVLLNTILGFFQEWRAERSLAALRQLSTPRAKVLRDNNVCQISAEEAVAGDILLLETGDRVAADARIIEADDLEVEESALTGESEPVHKHTASLEANLPVADRINMIWMSTPITAGRGRAVVVATGMNTQIGRIAAEVQSTRREETPLQKRLGKLGLWLGIGGVALAAVVLILGLVRGYDLVDMLLYAVAVAVSAIPEGLPAVTSVTLALGVQRMVRKHAVIRRLPAVETLGSTTVICTDKTGTITRSQMTVRRIWSDLRMFRISGEGYQPQGRILTEDAQPLESVPPALQRLLQAGIMANNATLRQTEGTWQVEGSPSEGALLVVAGKAGLKDCNAEKDCSRIDEIPFSSRYKYMATLHTADAGERVVWIKGAPEKILSFSSHILLNGKMVPLDERMRKEIRHAQHTLADQAYRVMAGAWRQLPPETQHLEASHVESGLTFLGLWGIQDPPRAETADAVAAAYAAGIRPIMITGDHAATAMAIARQVGIKGRQEAVTGSEVDTLDKQDLAKRALETGVFARVTPEHKLRILEALKEHGEIVAMTGDGVNDAPALKGADIGIAMGQTGTEVAKEAADMVLMDDNFATIVNAVAEGRLIYDNLRSVIFFLLATNLGEILTLAGALLIGLELPLTAVMILWINLVTDGACTIPLGVEPAHQDLLNVPPRSPRESILDRPLLTRILILTPVMAVGTLGLFWFFTRTRSLAYAQTAAFTTLAVFQWFQALNARSRDLSVFSIGLFGNRWLMVGLSAAILLQIAAVHTPLGQAAFKTVGLTLPHWILIIAVSSTIWILEEIRKRMRR